MRWKIMNEGMDEFAGGACAPTARPIDRCHIRVAIG
jgi:hypothetical protein